MNNPLINNLRALMDAADLSENQLAKRSGVNQPTINRILNGESRDPRRSNVAKLAEVFGMTAADLLGDISTGQKIAEHPAVYDVSARKIPVIEWSQARNWQDALKDTEHYKTWVAITQPSSKDWFALTVLNDSMQPQIPMGAKIAVDPKATAQNGDLVVACLPGVEEPTFKKLVIDAGIQQLHPLNDRYPAIVMQENAYILGVVKAALLTF